MSEMQMIDVAPAARLEVQLKDSAAVVQGVFAALRGERFNRSCSVDVP